MSLLSPSPTPNPTSQLNAGQAAAPVLEGVSARLAMPRPIYEQPATIPAEPPALNLQILRSLRMHGRRALMMGLSVAALCFVIYLCWPNLYTAQSLIYVEPIVARSLNEIGSPGFDQFRYNSYLDQQMQTVVRPDILAAAIKSLPAGTWKLANESDEDSIKRLAKRLVVERQLTSYQISVKLSDAKPQTAAAVVSAVTNAYLNGGRKDETTRADGRLQLLSEERQRVRNELDADRKEQAALGSSIGVANPIQPMGNPFDTSTANIRSQLQSARQARDVAQAQLESVSGQSPDHRSGLAAAADEAIQTDPGLSAFKSSANSRRVALQTAMSGLTPNNSSYKQYQEELAQIDRSIEAKTNEVRNRAEIRIQDKLRTELQRTAEVEGKLNGQLASETARATSAGSKLQRAQDIEADITRLNSRYTTIDEAYNALEVETHGPSMAHQVGTVEVPTSPDAGRRSLFLLAALPCGLLFGVSSAVILRLRDGRIYLGSDIQHAAGFAPMAVLPATAEVSRDVSDEYVLRLAAGIESAYRTAGAQSFILTAVSSDTSVTGLLHDLTRKLEDLRLRVRVVHATELMTTSDESMERKTAATDLRRASDKPAPAGEGIASSKLDRMRLQTDLILIEAAPILHSAETEYASRCADATILVVESGTTLASQLVEATTLLSRLRVNGVATVLDQLRLENADATFRTSIRVIEERTRERGYGRKQMASYQPEMKPQRSAPVAQATQPAQSFSAQSFAAKQPEPANQQPPVPRVAKVAEPLLPQSAPWVELAGAPHKVVPTSGLDWSVPATAPRAPAPVGYAPRVEPPLVQGSDSLPRPDSLRPAAPVARAVEPWPQKGSPVMSPPAQPPQKPLPADPESPRRSANPLPQELQARTAAEIAAALNPARMNGAGGDALRGTEARGAANQHIRPAHMPISAVPTLRPTRSEPEHPIGGMITENDRIAPVPAYTQSQIRRAFKEQEVSSKTKWFSKLFRGDSPSKIIPGEDDSFDSMEPDQRKRFDPVARPTESALRQDPEVQQLLDRIRPRGEMQPIQRIQRPVKAVKPEPAEEAPAPWNGQIDRRREARERQAEAAEEQAPSFSAQYAGVADASSGESSLAKLLAYTATEPSSEGVVNPINFRQVADLAVAHDPEEYSAEHSAQHSVVPFPHNAGEQVASNWEQPQDEAEAEPIAWHSQQQASRAAAPEPIAAVAAPSSWQTGEWKPGQSAQIEAKEEPLAEEEPDYSAIWAKHLAKPVETPVEPEEEHYTLNALGKRVAIFTSAKTDEEPPAPIAAAPKPIAEWSHPEPIQRFEPSPVPVAAAPPETFQSWAAPEPPPPAPMPPAAPLPAPPWAAFGEPVTAASDSVWSIPTAPPAPAREPLIAFPKPTEPIEWGRPIAAAEPAFKTAFEAPVAPSFAPVSEATVVQPLEPVAAFPTLAPKPVFVQETQAAAPAQAQELASTLVTPRRWALLSKFDPDTAAARDNES